MRILRIAAAGLLTAGLAAMASLSVTWVASASAGPFMAALQAFSIKFGLICLASAIGTRFLMPREADVTRPIRPGMASSPSPMLKLLLAVLAAAAVLQAPALARWFAQDQTLLYQITEGKTDDLGLALIPAVILFSMPVVAATAVITFVLSSVLGSLARAQLTFPILAACAALQAGLVVGERFVLGGVRSFGEALSKSGIVRREPDGPDLAAVRADGRTGLVGRHTYAVEDLATGALLGRLVPSGREWDIVHGSGSLVARVREESTGIGPWTYVAVTGDREMCRFTWALQGLSVNSAEMDVEFLEGWDGRFDRVLAIALAPMIEHRARLARQRGM